MNKNIPTDHNHLCMKVLKNTHAEEGGDCNLSTGCRIIPARLTVYYSYELPERKEYGMTLIIYV